MIYYSGTDENYKKLNGMYRRAVELEAYIQILGRRLSKTLGNKYKNKQVAQSAFNNLCETYSQDPNKVKELAIKESKIFYMHPLTKDRQMYYEQKASEIALNIDIGFNSKLNISHIR